MKSTTGRASNNAAKQKKRGERLNDRTGLSTDAIAHALIDNLHCLQAKTPQHATRNDWYMALAYTARDRLLDRYIRTVDAIAAPAAEGKVVAYLSAEFLTGPHLGNGLIALGIWEAAEQALSEVGQNLTDLLAQEEEPGLGNGGLGRLAACYMDSLASLSVPAIGYGIRYEFGIFDQAIRDGWQVELTDKWLRFGNPWEIVRSEITFDVKLGGRTEAYVDVQGQYRVRWLPEAVGSVINEDPAVGGLLKVVFLPDFNVKNSHRVYPAAELSEQISTAGKEASGTGNMKFAMNGALTIGTLDGANVEIRDAVGPENFFLFGLTADEVDERKASGYTPLDVYESNAELREAIDQIRDGFFANGDREIFRPLVDSLLARDDYMLLADYQAYIDCQQRVSDAYRDEISWTRMSILNSARVGRFSSDRSIRDYCRDIWNVSPITPVQS